MSSINQPADNPSSLRSKLLRRCLPKSIYNPLIKARKRYFRERCLWSDPRWEQNLNKLNSLKDQYQGKRCFILGNGPSLNKTPLHLLKDEVTFGLNRIYLKFDEIGFATTFLVCVNRLVMEQFGQELASQPCQHFFDWNDRELIPSTERTHFMNTEGVLDTEGLGECFFFSKDPCAGIYEGFTVTYVALQLAYYMGFSKVVMIGVDHRFADKGAAGQTVTSGGDDPNHFAANYFGAGVKWQLPDLIGSEIAYTLARRAFEEDGREIVDATIDGALQVFPKVEFNSLF